MHSTPGSGLQFPHLTARGLGHTIFLVLYFTGKPLRRGFVLSHHCLRQGWLAPSKISNLDAGAFQPKHFLGNKCIGDCKEEKEENIPTGPGLRGLGRTPLFLL